MVIAFAVSIFGFISVNRMSHIWMKKKMFSANVAAWIQIFTLLLILYLLIQQIKVRFLAGVFLLIHVLLNLFPIYLEYHRRVRFRESVLSAVDAILLSLKAGKSFRDSLIDLRKSGEDFGFYVTEIVTIVLLRQSTEIMSDDRFLKGFYLELKKSDSSSHRVVDRIKSYRYQIRIEENFRQKSSLATLQARAQSLVVSLLYVFALVFDLVNFPGNLSWRILILSLGLFLAGNVWIWNIGRRHTWKV